MTPLQTAFRSESVNVTSADWALSGSARPIGIYCNGASTITAALCGNATTATVWNLTAGMNWLAFGLIQSASTTKSAMYILYK
jgi:hypothetical protein